MKAAATLTLRLAAHPSLDQRQQEAIAHDYRMEDNELAIAMRLPVAFYFIKRYNLDLQDAFGVAAAFGQGC